MKKAKSKHYFDTSYDSKQRLCSYWHQIHEIIRLAPKRVVEIGVGNGFVAGYLRERGVDVVTLDIDGTLNPDVVGNVLDLPFSDKSSDVVACCEVLEHLPYRDVDKALCEILRVCRSYAILSLPETSKAYRFSLQIPKIGEIKLLIPVPSIRRQIHRFDGAHYWEIGKSEYSLNRIVKDISKVGFTIESTYRVFEYPYHRFFILSA
ncbi:MAG: methyltransferase domain-containing protein [Candidatus Zixiibacteriota bacterium]|nr:MAG: methyltransferase domain-containing protein [candidate division Zixibacteria bacterium]